VLVFDEDVLVCGIGRAGIQLEKIAKKARNSGFFVDFGEF